jgi:glycosyltransferase involved in cell wall biosynthesis
MKSQLRFLLLNTFYPPYSFGGDAIYVWRLANALAADGHLVDVIHCADAYEMLAGDRALPPALPSHANVTVYGLRGRARALAILAAHQTGFPLGRRAQIAHAMAGKHYDVLHFNNISMFGPRILALTPEGQPPIKLYTASEYWLICERHMLWKFDQSACGSEQCLQCAIRAGRPPQLWRYSGLIDRMAANIDRFLAPSRAVARIHAERGFRPAMDCLPLFTEVPSESDLRSLPRPFERPYFLFVGRLETLKGADVLLAAWNRISEAELVIAGDGSELTRLKLRAAGNPRIHFLGHVAQPNLSALYFHARACIVPSLFEEPFGLIAIEALAHRTPVIAHNVGGLREIVEESGGGLLYETEDQLLVAIHELRHSDASRTAMGERGYSACLERWSRTAHLRRYYGLIGDIEAARCAEASRGGSGKHGFAI